MLGHDSLGDEDLLLGILRADAGVAAEALSSLEVTLDTARGEFEEMLSNALSSIGVSLEKVRRCRIAISEYFPSTGLMARGPYKPLGSVFAYVFP